MSRSFDELLELASSAFEESDLLDFKREFTPEKKAAFWAETVKDIVAFANSRGGVLVFGLNDDGSDSGFDCAGLLSFDIAQLADQIKKYTDFNFKGMKISQVEKAGKVYPCILISPVNVPMVFSKVGTYEYEDGKQKAAFSLGTIYFRHGAKSEPCTRDDITDKIQENLHRIREEWLGNIRKVVEAEPGSSVVVTRSGGSSERGQMRITDDPDAPIVRFDRLSDGYPHRQTDVIKRVNKVMPVGVSMNAHDIQAIKLFEHITPEKTPNYLHKPHEKSSPQYTEEFIALIIERYQSDGRYFLKCREHWKRKKYSDPD